VQYCLHCWDWFQKTAEFRMQRYSELQVNRKSEPVKPDWLRHLPIECRKLRIEVVTRDQRQWAANSSGDKLVNQWIAQTQRAATSKRTPEWYRQQSLAIALKPRPLKPPSVNKNLPQLNKPASVRHNDIIQPRNWAIEHHWDQHPLDDGRPPA
jgi:hypothetical protein